jgi:endoglucanase
MDKIISYMGTKGIAVLLDMHSFGPGQASSNGYWYDGSHSEATVIQGWTTLATRYKNYWNVIGMDIKNEPFSSTWGSGNINTDFNLAAQRIGNAITANSNWLVFVEGITCQSGCFWGENLQGVQFNPVVLNVPNRVVYSPHAYGPDVYGMNYFNDASFPANMPAIWNTHFGFIRNLANTDSAVVIGEWGGTTNSPNLAWLNAFSSYLKTTGMTDNFFWAVNQNSGQTGGIVQGDWITPETAKLNIIASVVPNPTNLLSVINSTGNYTPTNSTSNTTTGTNSTNTTNTNTTNTTKTNTTNTNTTNANTTNSTTNTSCNIVYSS